jgi:hypothetical protein
MILRKLCLLAAALYLVFPFVSSGEPTTPTRLAFEVASIKSSQSAAGAHFEIKPLPGGSGYTAQNVPFKLMMSLMYKVPCARSSESEVDQYRSLRYRSEGRHPSSVDDLHVMFSEHAYRSVQFEVPQGDQRGCGTCFAEAVFRWSPPRRRWRFNPSCRGCWGSSTGTAKIHSPDVFLLC